MNSIPPRIHVLLASEASTGVVIRRRVVDAAALGVKNLLGILNKQDQVELALYLQHQPCINSPQYGPFDPLKTGLQDPAQMQLDYLRDRPANFLMAEPMARL